MSCSEWKETEVGKIPSHWNIYTVDELVKEKILDKPLDGNHGSIHPTQKDFVEYGIPFIMASDIKNNNIDYSTCKFITEEQSKTLKKGFAKEGDVLLTHKATIGRTCIVKDLNTPYIVLTPQVTYYRILDNTKLNNEFLKYYFLFDKFSELLNNWSQSGSTRAYIGITAQGKLPIIVPPLKEQEKIVDILSSLDDKIELNNEMNKTLEEMAQSIFKRWFVDFEFPNEDGQPYKSSGGEMVESELGMIPNGWEVSTIYDLAEYINGTSFKSKDYGESGLPIIKIAELKNGITESTKFFLGNKDEKFYLKNRDILFSWSGNPDTSIDTFIWYKGDAILNQHIFKVIPKDNIGYSFIYLMLKYLKKTFTEIARNKQTTGLGHVTVKDLKNIKLAIDYNKVSEFNSVVDSLINQIIENYYNNEILNTIKNSILPKLMNGKIKLK